MQICPPGKYGRVGAVGQVEALRKSLRGNTAASDGGAASAWALTPPPSARPAEAYACPLRPGVQRGRAVRAGGGQGGAPHGRVFLTPTDAGTPRCSIARLAFRTWPAVDNNPPGAAAPGAPWTAGVSSWAWARWRSSAWGRCR